MPNDPNCPTCANPVTLRAHGMIWCGHCRRNWGADTTLVVDENDFKSAGRRLAVALANSGQVWWDVKSQAPVRLFLDHDRCTVRQVDVSVPQNDAHTLALVDISPPRYRSTLHQYRAEVLSHPGVFPHLEAVTTTPEFSYDVGPEQPARILRRGFNPDRHKIYVGPKIEPKKTGELEHLFEAIPFVDEVSLRNWLALLYTLIMPDHAAPYPIWLILGDDQGVGKTSLVQLTSLLVTGQHPEIVPWGEVKHSKESAARRIVAAVKSGRRILLYDNLTGYVHSNFIATAATSGEMSCSALYRVGTEVVSGTFLQAMTSNFAHVSLDLCTRSVVTKLSIHKMTDAWYDFDVSDWHERRIPILQDILYYLYHKKWETTTERSPIRFRRWWRHAVAAVGELDPQALHYRYRSIDFEMCRILEDFGMNKGFTPQDLFEAYWRKKSSFEDTFLGAKDVCAFRDRLGVLTKYKFHAATHGFHLVQDGDKFLFREAK